MKKMIRAVGCGLLLSVCAMSNGHANEFHDARAPEWLIGHYKGGNKHVHHDDYTLVVEGNGRAQVYDRDRPRNNHAGHYTRAGEIEWDDGTRSRVTRTARGVNLTLVGHGNDLAIYERDRSGPLDNIRD